LAAGVKVTLPPTSVTVPPTGLPTPVTVRVSPASGSVSFASRLATVIVTGVSSAVLKLSAFAVGASCAGVTLTVTVPVSVPPLPSLTV
jgi:hypothetical protein